MCSIILVHGLRGHPRRTWASKNGSPPENTEQTPRGLKRLVARRSKSSSETSVKAETRELSDIYWPQDYLPQDIPEARIWTYGYNSDPVGSFSRASNQNNISQHGQDLANRIDREIDNEVDVDFYFI